MLFGDRIKDGDMRNSWTIKFVDSAKQPIMVLYDMNMARAIARDYRARVEYVLHTVTVWYGERGSPDDPMRYYLLSSVDVTNAFVGV